MATYVVDPTDPTSPLDTDDALQGAEEFRDLKAYISPTGFNGRSLSEDLGIKGGTLLSGSVGFRLTLVTNNPIPTTDQLAKSTIFLTPYRGNILPLFINGVWKFLNTVEISCAVPATTNTPFDIFADDIDNDGVVTLSTVDWTNDTTRATDLALQDYVYVLSGIPGKLYVGTGRTTGVAGETKDADAGRCLWNWYNPVPRKLRVFDPASTWSYASATYRYANGNSDNKVEFITGIAALPVNISAVGLCGGTDATGVVAVTGIGINSGTTPNTQGTLGQGCGTGTFDNNAQANLIFFPAIGYNYLAWLEATNARTGNFFGTNSTGMLGSIYA